MKLTPDQRRKRIYELMEQNEEFRRIRAELDPAEARFRKFTDRLPKWLRNRLREYPGMQYFMYQRILDAVCRTMKFPDED